MVEDVSTQSPRVAPSETRIRPDVLNVALLDEIAWGIRELLARVEEQVPKGNLIPVTVTLSGPDARREDIKPPWFSMVIVNDGPDQAEFTVNSIGNRFSVLPINEIMPIDMKRGVIRTLWLRSISGGTATVRIYGVT